MVPEAPLTRVGTALVAAGEGWFVLNAHDAHWLEGDFGAFTRFEGDVRFPQVGVNIGVLEPGQPSSMYHGENEQEDFLVLSGECVLLIEGEERALKAWDFVHCPPWAEHVFVGAGTGPCVLLGVGSRTGGDVVYPVLELAKRHGAGVDTETREPDEAYAPFRAETAAQFRDEWLPRR